MASETWIRELKADNRSGSSVIMNRIIEVVQRELLGGASPETIRNGLVELQSHFGVFAVLRHFVSEFEEHRADPARCLKFVKEYQNAWKQVNKRCAKNFLKHFNLNEATVLLHSSSGVVIEIFRQMTSLRQRARIIQTESRPAFEGRQQAKTLASMGHDVTLIADMAFVSYLSQTDWVILGADAICREGFINKIGSCAIALAAFHQNIPLLVAADSRKMTGTCDNFTGPPKPPEEIHDDRSVKVENFYFEMTPASYVNSYISEDALFTPGFPTSDFQE